MAASVRSPDGRTTRGRHGLPALADDVNRPTVVEPSSLSPGKKTSRTPAWPTTFAVIGTAYAAPDLGSTAVIVVAPLRSAVIRKWRISGQPGPRLFVDDTDRWVHRLDDQVFARGTTPKRPM